MLYLKIIKEKTYESYSKLFKEHKNRIGILVRLDQTVFKLKITSVKMLFGSITKNHLAYLNFDAIFEFLGQFTINAYIIFQKRCWSFWHRPQNVLMLGRRCSTPLRIGLQLNVSFPLFHNYLEQPVVSEFWSSHQMITFFQWNLTPNVPYFQPGRHKVTSLSECPPPE